MPLGDDHQPTGVLPYPKLATPGLSNEGANQICRHIIIHLRVGTVLAGSMGRQKNLTFVLDSH